MTAAFGELEWSVSVISKMQPRKREGTKLWILLRVFVPSWLVSALQTSETPLGELWAVPMRGFGSRHWYDYYHTMV